jgi:hypothetical protein
MPIVTTPYDSADYLDTNEQQALYIASYYEDGAPEEVDRALETARHPVQVLTPQEAKHRITLALAGPSAATASVYGIHLLCRHCSSLANAVRYRDVPFNPRARKRIFYVYIPVHAGAVLL